jgi:hypothetical protein
VKNILALLFLLAAPALAAYAPKEMCVIPWGDSANQLKIEQPWYDESEEGHQYLVPGGGPKYGFIDNNENVYINSESLMYLKAFNSDGEEILNLDTKYSINGDTIPLRPIMDFYVDFNSNIYLQCSNPISTDILVLDKTGNLIDRINPCQLGTGGNTAFLEGYGYDDLISIGCAYGYYYTYYKCAITEGGSDAYKARDGSYYFAYIDRNEQLKFSKETNVSLSGKPALFEEKYFPLDTSLAGCRFLGVDDSMNIYMAIFRKGSDGIDAGIRLYNTSFEVIDQFWFSPFRENHYLMRMDSPFFRHDGNIYEFRCLDDGLHVIRWSRK